MLQTPWKPMSANTGQPNQYGNSRYLIQSVEFKKNKNVHIQCTGIGREK